MRTICLSTSTTLDHEKIRPLYEKIISANRRCAFFIDRTNPVLEEMIKKYRCRKMRFHLQRALMRARAAYADRAKRIVEKAQSCYCVVDSKDKYAGPVEIAVEFMERHPDLHIEIYFVTGGEWKQVTMREARKGTPWDTFLSK